MKTGMKMPACVGMLVSEACTRGGIQSFMQSIFQVLSRKAASTPGQRLWVYSLNDTTQALKHRFDTGIGGGLFGAGGSKVAFLLQALLHMPRTQVLLVGHLTLAPVAYLLKKLRRVEKYYVILHGIEAWQRRTWLQRVSLKAAEKLVATTQYTARECARCNAIGHWNFAVIPLCVPSSSGIPASAFRLRGTFKLLCVARQDQSERYKGFDQLLAAMARLRHHVPGIHLNLVGNGTDQVRLKAEVEKAELQEFVSFLGELPDADLTAAYQDCDVFVMPSQKEGFGIVFLEAMYHAKPCIGGNHGGTPEVIQHQETGFLVEHGDVEQLAGFIQRLADDPGLRLALGQAGQALLRTRFDSGSFEQAYLSLLVSDSP